MTTTIDYTLHTERRLSVMAAEIAKAQQIVADCAGQMSAFLATIAKVYDRPIDALYEAYNGQDADWLDEMATRESVRP